MKFNHLPFFFICHFKKLFKECWIYFFIQPHIFLEEKNIIFFDFFGEKKPKAISPFSFSRPNIFKSGYYWLLFLCREITFAGNTVIPVFGKKIVEAFMQKFITVTTVNK